jgi:hypothetical protein
MESMQKSRLASAFFYSFRCERDPGQAESFEGSPPMMWHFDRLSANGFFLCFEYRKNLSSIGDQSACLRKKAGISISSMPLLASASTLAAAVRVRHTLGVLRAS